MMNNLYKGMSKKYQSVDLESRINEASPHELITLMLQGTRNYISNALGAMQRKNIREKGEQLGKALATIDGLRACLDYEKGGEVAAHLYKFYKEIQALLVSANIKNDEALLLKCNALLANILEAWNAIKPNGN